MSDQKVCPRCQTANEIPALVRREYRCGGCGLELAHLDMAANGAVRGVFGWLLDPGSVVSERYRITGVLGKGGFGVTYLVDDLRLQGKRRALKEVPALLFDEYETKLLGRLNHPAIPDITDRLDLEGMVYLVLEFGGNRTLRTEQERHGGRIPVFVLLPWIEQTCDALIYLHAQDPPIIHRDLKPENILLDDNDRVMLIDFGIAKESGGEAVTRTIGRAVTHGFSPPEQVLGTGTDVRSDVYALGAILYAALTGKVPPPAHERVTGTALEPPASLVPEIPPLLDATIRQALELNLHARPQSVEELARTLALVRSGGTGERTVFVSDPRTLSASLGTHREVRLPSVKLPSTHYTQSADPAPPQVEPRRRGPARGLIWGAVGVVLVGLAGAGAWVYLREAGPEPLDTPKAAATPPVSAAPAAPTPEPEARVLPAAPISAGETPIPAPTATPTEPAPQTLAVPATAATPTPAITPQVGAAAGLDVAPKAGPAPLDTPKTVFSGDLPSIFSDDKRPAAAPSAPTPAGSLMELFETQRAESLSKTAPSPSEPAAEPAKDQANSQPAPPPSAVTPPAKKIEKKAAETKPKRPASQSAASAAKNVKPSRPTQQPAGNAAWTIRPLGAHKTD
jgi:serine/threonine-protein kinase